MKTKIAGTLANMALLLASCLVSLLLCEAGLRLFHPKYEHLAKPAFIRDPNLGFARIPNKRAFFRHPDTDAWHPFHHNNFGLRQHRNFSASDLESSVNIGFFGDSFTENIRIEVQFSFTEPLDYLLNTGGGEVGKVNVLNFGSEGYSTWQSLRRYEMWDFREALDHVFYVYSDNDLAGNFRAAPFRLDDRGELVSGKAASSSRFALLSKLHLSYLVLDASGRLSAHLGEIKAKAEQRTRKRWQRIHNYGSSSAFALFRQLLRHWKEAVEKNGASFYLMLLPMENRKSASLAAIFKEEGVETVNLPDCFGERDPAHLRTPWSLSPYRFANDGHWNEAGNRLAAICLHRFLEGTLGLPQLSEQEVEQALSRYYSAFEVPAAQGQPASPQAAAIRGKYDAFDEDLWDAQAPLSGKLAIRSRFDVYLHPGGWLAYVKEGCKPADFDERFFLHVVPADAQDLPPDRREHGFDNLGFLLNYHDATCLVWRKLPSYAIERFRTGQSVKEDDGAYRNLWQGEHVFSDG